MFYLYNRRLATRITCILTVILVWLTMVRRWRSAHRPPAVDVALTARHCGIPDTTYLIDSRPIPRKAKRWFHNFLDDNKAI